MIKHLPAVPARNTCLRRPLTPRCWRRARLKLTGGCNCGEVRYEIEGDPVRVGLCHCETCRKDSGSAFSYFGVWRREHIIITGETGSWSSPPGSGGRHFCRSCGSSLFSGRDDEVEFRLGTLDNPPVGLMPKYEVWTIRREPWIEKIGRADQFDRDAE